MREGAFEIVDVTAADADRLVLPAVAPGQLQRDTFLRNPRRGSFRRVRSELAQEFQKVYEHQVARGILQRTGSPGEYAPTLRGGFHIVWRNAFPVLAIRRALYYSRMSRLESQLRSGAGSA